MAKMGRPKSDKLKDTQLGVRLDADLLAKIDENAKFYHETRAESLRRGIELLNQCVRKKQTVDRSASYVNGLFKRTIEKAKE